MEIKNGSLIPLRKMNKEKIDADENKFEREAWEDKKSGILALGAGEEIKFLQSGWSAIHMLIHSVIPSFYHSK